MKRIAIVLLLMLGMLGGRAVAAPKFDILIVTDKSHGEQKSLAHSLRALLERQRADNNMTSEDLPVDEYDASYAGHQPALRRLGITRAQIPFIGICALGGKDALPVKVLSGVGPVHEVQEAVSKLMAATHRDLGWNYGGTTTNASVHFDAAEMATGVDADYHPIEATDRYASGDSFFITLHSPDFVSGTPVTARWYHGSEAIGTKTITPAVDGGANLYFQLNPDHPWAPGSYHCDILVNNTLSRRVGFEVSGGQHVVGATMCQSLDSDAQTPIGPTETFSKKARLNVSIELQDVQDGDTIDVRFFNRSGLLGNPHLDLQAERHTFCGFWLTPESTWTTGPAHVEVYYNGHLEQTVPFTINP